MFLFLLRRHQGWDLQVTSNAVLSPLRDSQTVPTNSTHGPVSPLPHHALLSILMRVSPPGAVPTRTARWGGLLAPVRVLLTTGTSSLGERLRRHSAHFSRLCSQAFCLLVTSDCTDVFHRF